VTFNEIAQLAGKTVDGAGIAIIVVGVLVATARFLDQWRRAVPVDGAYRHYRKGLGMAILLGLEFLVAGDIIRTVAVQPTFTSVGVLALIVLIRTFLSLEIGMEVEGRWPWQRGKAVSVTTTLSSSDAARREEPSRRRE
jgi:uncharacterized membrane protein